MHSYKITHKTKKIIEIFMQTFIIKLSTDRRENLTKTDLLHYMESRVNDSMSAMGFSKVFEDGKDLKSTDFFFEEVFADSMDDFFANRPVDYTLGDKSITSEDLFD